MFIGNINRLPNDKFLSASFISLMQKAFAEIKKKPVVGEYLIQDNDLFYNIICGECSSASGKQAEIHNEHIDVHLVLDGQDQIGYSVKELEVDDESMKDSVFFRPTGSRKFCNFASRLFHSIFPS